jgi:hypothetical protein
VCDSRMSPKRRYAYPTEPTDVLWISKRLVLKTYVLIVSVTMFVVVMQNVIGTLRINEHDVLRVKLVQPYPRLNSLPDGTCVVDGLSEARSGRVA